MHTILVVEVIDIRILVALTGECSSRADDQVRKKELWAPTNSLPLLGKASMETGLL